MNPSAPEADVVESQLSRLADEFVARLDGGEQPDVEEYAARYPELSAVLRQVLPALQVLRVPAPATADPLAAAQHAAPLGDFRLLREIGRGGMGVVYEAEQISLGRRVALKVLPFASTLDAKQLQRFKNEAQAAAHLHHQNIVPVYATGCERGVHYYAMQYVEGQTLAQVIADFRLQHAGLKKEAVADSMPLPLPADAAATAPYFAEPAGQSANAVTTPEAGISTERSTRSPRYFRTTAQLGVQAAEALEHAHEMGVVHRDIKPANLLVDGRGHLWVTDFGLAHCQSQVGLTMSGDLVGTLRYMSPEQALAQRVMIDHRTDIYSIGATLYELLTLEPAFGGRDRQELLRQIAFEEPRLPKCANTAIPPDLETIVLKAMSKNPDERYSSAQDLADDLRRFLKDEPILAKRPTLAQRARKWTRRHQTSVMTGIVTAFGILVVAVGALLGQNARLTKARDDARAAELHAREAEAEARATADFLTSDMLALAPEGVAAATNVTIPPGQRLATPFEWLYAVRATNLTITEALDAAVPEVDRLLGQQPRVEAAVRHVMGTVYRFLGQPEKARLHLEQAVALRRRELGEEHLSTLNSQHNLCNVLHAQGELDAAETLCRQVLESRRKNLPPGDIHIASSCALLGLILTDKGDLDQAEAFLREALGIFARALSEGHWRTANVRSSLGCCLMAQHRYAEAEPELLAACRALQSHPTSPRHLTQGIFYHVVLLYEAWGKKDKADEWRKRSQRLAGAEKAETK
jgi:serine/threonine protein kinase/tetratricopeptide (TPR) repeat protein